MKLIHTSPTEISQIRTSGRFGSFLFFSSREYVMTAGAHIAYSIEIDAADVIRAGALFYHEAAATLDVLVAEIAARYEVGEETAEALIDESASIYDVDSNVDAEDLADAAWDIQHATACAGKLLGFRAVEVTDEQGTAYLVDMLGRESELARIA